MPWLSEHENDLRVVLLVLLVVALVGPWTYTSDGVPPPEWCRRPNILLENGRCVRLVPGVAITWFGAGALLSLSAQLVTGTMGVGRIREFLVGLFLLPTLPVITTLLVLWRSESRRLRVAHAVAWALAAGSALLLVLSSAPSLGRLWGVWLSIGLAASALILELRALGRRHGTGVDGRSTAFSREART